MPRGSGSRNPTGSQRPRRCSLLSAHMSRSCRRDSSFTAADFAAEQGCTLLARREDVKDHELLTAFLCQCGYAKLLTAEEVGTLGGKADSDCVLLRTKFLMWVSEKTAGKAV